MTDQKVVEYAREAAAVVTARGPAGRFRQFAEALPNAVLERVSLGANRFELEDIDVVGEVGDVVLRLMARERATGPQEMTWQWRSIGAALGIELIRRQLPHVPIQVPDDPLDEGAMERSFRHMVDVLPEPEMRAKVKEIVDAPRFTARAIAKPLSTRDAIELMIVKHSPSDRC